LRFPILAIAALLVGLVPAAAGPRVGHVTTIGVPDLSLEATMLADLNGDGRDDLLVSASTWNRSARSLLVYLRRDGTVPFGSRPDRTLELTPDVVAYAAGDVESHPGAEVVLFTAGGAYAWGLGDGEDERPRRLIRGDFLWQLPHPGAAFAWTGGVRDLDGDGFADLVFPEPGGYLVAFQRRRAGKPATFDRLGALRLPVGDSRFYLRGEQHRSREQWKEIQIGLNLGTSDKDRDRSVISVWESVPLPLFLDWDADGRTDLLALTSEELLVWRQKDGGGYAGVPDRRQTFPLVLDRSRRLDLSFGSHAGDLNGDGRADCVILAGDRDSDEPRTQILVYVQGAGRGRAAQTAGAPLFGPKGIPQQVLVVGGFTGSTDLTDVDGNGLPDLVLGTLKVDAMDAIRAASSGKLDANLYVYANTRGRFSRQPVLQTTVKLETKNLDQAGRNLMAQFIGDVLGDGTSDLMIRDDPERIRIFAVRRARSGLMLLPEPVFQMRVDKRADVYVHRPAPNAPPELVIREEKKRLQHVRFR
jgi:hypothetical protein